MIEIKGKKFCENCFEEITGYPCPACGCKADNGAADPSMLPPGSVLLEKYIIGRVIGKGGFGVIYLSYDTVSEKKVAIKEYFPYGLARRAAEGQSVEVAIGESEDDFEKGAEKLYEEAKLISEFKGNPNIAEVYEYFYENNTVYLAMEYLRGQTLKEYIRDNGMLTAPQALYTAKGVASALAATHKASVLHRDISPENIILCEDGRIKVIDFGAARQVTSERTKGFSVILKPGFAPPEQYSKKGKQGPWSDVYSLATTIYYAMTGDVPEESVARFDDDDTFRENSFGIESELWNVILKATSLKNEDRYKDAEELLKDLNNIRMKPRPVILSEDVKEPGGAVPLNMTSYNYKQHISFSPEKKKKGYFAEHSRLFIALAAGAAAITAAVVIMRTALNNNSGISDVPDTSELQNSTVTFSETDADSDIKEEQSPDEAQERVYLADAKIVPTLYSTLEGDAAELYELIYNCLANSDEVLELSSEVYDRDTVEAVYQKVLFDNPCFFYAEPFDTDIRNGFVEKIKPVYIETDRAAMEEEASEIARICRKDNNIDTLCAIHDYIIANTMVIQRGSAPLGSTAYGTAIEGCADDIGFAKAFCYYVQKAGLPCYVVEGEFMGEPRAWCRFKLENDIWYNADVYGDKFAGSVVTKLKITDVGDYFQTYFLTNDEYILTYGYTLSPEYEYLLESEYAAASPKGNYYFQRNYQYYFFSGPDATYDLIIETIANKYKDGGNNSIALYVAPFVIDRLYDKMNAQFLPELEELYGITASGFTMEYSPNVFIVELD